MASGGFAWKRLLDGVENPVDNSTTWKRELEHPKLGGARGIELARQFNEIFVTELKWDCATEADCLPVLTACLWLVSACALASAACAHDLATTISGIVNEQSLAEAKDASERNFREQLARLANKFGVGAAIEGTEPKELLHDRWQEAIRLLPAMHQMEWPFGDCHEDDIASAWRPVSKKETGYFLASLPTAGRVLYIRNLYALAANKAHEVISSLKASFRSLKFLDEPLSLDANYRPYSGDGGESNLIRIVRRMNYLVSLAVAVLCATETTRQDTIKDFRIDASDPIETPEVPSIEELKAIVDLCFTQTEHIQGSWVTSTPGVEPSPPVFRSDRSDGLRFLSDQLKSKESVYRIPVVTDGQRVWEAWFLKVLDLQTMFNDLPAELIIPILTGSVKTDDRRVYGWHDKVLAMRHNQRKPTLAEFVQHIRSQVLATNTTRREASHELERLRFDCSELSDCMALLTKLKQLFAQLHPPESDEHEPMSRLTAVRHVHNLLQGLHRQGLHGKPGLVRAWKNYTAYDGSVMFAQYVDAKLHEHDKSEQVTAAYLVAVCTHLEQAHRQYVQTIEPEEEHLRGKRNVSSVNAAAHLLNMTPTTLAAWIKTGAPSGSRASHGQKRAASQPPARTSEPEAPQILAQEHLSTYNRGYDRRSGAGRGRGGRGRSDFHGRGRSYASAGHANGGHGGGNHPRAAVANAEISRGEVYARILEDMKDMHDMPALATIRQKLGLPAINFDEAKRRVREDKACALCQETDHNYSRCPALKQRDPELQRVVKAIRPEFQRRVARAEAALNK